MINNIVRNWRYTRKLLERHLTEIWKDTGKILEMYWKDTGKTLERHLKAIWEHTMKPLERHGEYNLKTLEIPI